MALAEYGNAFNIDTDGSGNPILVDPQSGDTIAIYDRGTSSWQVTTIEATTGDFDSLNAEDATIAGYAPPIEITEDIQGDLETISGQNVTISPGSTHEVLNVTNPIRIISGHIHGWSPRDIRFEFDSGGSLTLFEVSSARASWGDGANNVNSDFIGSVFPLPPISDVTRLRFEHPQVGDAGDYGYRIIYVKQ